MFKLKSIILSALLVFAFSSTVLAGANWWDAKDVKKNSDGTVEYSFQLDNFMNKNNGDIFNGLVVSKYGRQNKFNYSKTSKSIYTMKDYLGKSIVALKGTINGKDVSNIPLTQPVDVKYIAHNEKCKHAIITDNKKSELGKYDRITKKKGVEVSANCGCPIITTTNAGVEKGHFPAVYIPTRDVNAIVNAVESIFSSPQLQENLSSSVFNFANKEYSPEQYEKNLISFFKDC